MKKSIATLLTITGIACACTTSFQTQAAGTILYAGSPACDSVTELLKQAPDIEGLQDKLASLGIDCNILTLGSCPELNLPEFSLPGCNLPGIQKPDLPNNTPETPDTNVPDTDTPGTDTPDTKPDVPESGESAYVQEILRLVNAERAKAGLAALTLDASVTKAAQVRAIEIETSFSHTRPDGSSFSTALQEQGVSYRGSGENIAWGQKSPEAVMNAWMNSDGHRANILNKNFTAIGIGHHQDAAGRNYWSQLFTY